MNPKTAIDMSIRKFQIIALMAIILMFLSNGSRNYSADQLNRVNSTEITEIFDPQIGNDFYFNPPPSFGSQNPVFSSPESIDQILTNGIVRSSPIGHGGFDPILMNPSVGNFYQLRNNTNVLENMIARLELDELLNTTNGNLDGTNLVENLLLDKDVPYIFRFEVEPNEVNMPLVLDMNVQANGDRSNFQILIIEPNGAVTPMFPNLDTFNDEFFPILPSQPGDYLVEITPLSEDVILSQLAILDGFPIEPIENGFIRTFTGSEPIIQFFEIDPLDFEQDQAGNLDLDFFARQNTISTDPPGSDFFSSVNLKVHTPMGPPTGIPLPGSVWYYGQTIVSLVIDSPRFLSRTVVDTGPNPYEDRNMDLALWSDFEPFPILPIGEDFQLENNHGEFLYYLEQDTILGLNDSISVPGSSIFTECTFNPLSTGEPFTLQAGNNDPLNHNNANFYVGLAGGYIVSCDGFSNDGLQIIEFDEVRVLEIGGNDLPGSRYNEPVIVKIPSNSLYNDYFNITYIDQRNMSVSYEIDVFDDQGNHVSGFTEEFHNYGNANNLEFNVAINTNFAALNVNGGYLRIKQIGNTIWNSTLTTPVEIDTDDPLVISNLRIERLNNLQVDTTLNPDNQYFTGQLVNGINQFLNVSRNLIAGYYTYVSHAGGNRLVFTSTNMSMQVKLYATSTSSWFNQFTTLKVVDGLNIYTTVLEFGTFNTTEFGVEVLFNLGANGNTNNGTFSVLIETTDPYEFPVPEIGELTFTRTDSGRIPQQLTTNKGSGSDFPVDAAVVTIATIVVVASVGGLVLRSRRRI